MKLNNLQILRGISAILVCCFHFRGDLNFDTNQWGNALFEKGSIGVPVFFVISGYIMVFSTRKISHLNIGKNILSFYKKRIIRIVPLYYLLTFFWIFLSGSILYFLNENPEKLIKSFLFLPEKDQFPILFLGWSLNFEMFFYFIFALSLLFKKYRYFAIIAFFVIAMISGFIFKPENAILKMVTGTLNIYFIIGILLGLYLNKIQLDQNILKVICAISILIFIGYIFNFYTITNELFAVIPVTLFVAAFLIFDLFLKVKANSFFKMLGDISYSIYLSHPFVEVFFKRFHPDSPLLLIGLFIVKLGVVILISKILYEFIENRFTKFLKRKLLPHY